MSSTLQLNNLDNRSSSDTFIKIITSGITDKKDRERVIVELEKNEDLMKVDRVMDDTMNSLFQVFGITFNQKGNIIIPTGDCGKDMAQLKKKYQDMIHKKEVFMKKVNLLH